MPATGARGRGAGPALAWTAGPERWVSCRPGLAKGQPSACRGLPHYAPSNLPAWPPPQFVYRAMHRYPARLDSMLLYWTRRYLAKMAVRLCRAASRSCVPLPSSTSCNTAATALASPHPTGGGAAVHAGGPGAPGAAAVRACHAQAPQCLHVPLQWFQHAAGERGRELRRAWGLVREE